MVFFYRIFFIFCSLFAQAAFATNPDAIVDLRSSTTPPAIMQLTSRTKCAAVRNDIPIASCLCCMMQSMLFATGVPTSPFQGCSFNKLCKTEHTTELSRMFPGVNFNYSASDPNKVTLSAATNAALQKRNLTPVLLTDSLTTGSTTMAHLSATKGLLNPALVVKLLQDLVAARKLTVHLAEIQGGLGCLDVTSAAGGAQTAQLFVVKTRQTGCNITAATAGKVVFIVKELKKQFEEISNIEKLRAAPALPTFIVGQEGNAGRIGIALSYANGVYMSPGSTPKAHYMAVLVPARGVSAKALLENFAQGRTSKADLERAFMALGRDLAQFHLATATSTNDETGATSLVHGDLHQDNVFIDLAGGTQVRVTLIDAESMALSLDRPGKSVNDVIRLLAHATSHFTKSGFISTKTPAEWEEAFVEPFLQGYIDAFPAARKKPLTAYLVRTFSDANIFKIATEQGTVYNPVEWRKYKKIVLDVLAAQSRR